MLRIGDVVTFIDQVGKRRAALVTHVWPGMSGADGEPGCNVVCVSDDERKDDSYGRQLERFTSVVHKSSQTAPGNYWE